MEKTMTTSKKMTSGQIDRACEILRAKLTKYAPEFSSEAVQWALGQSELSVEWMKTFERRVKAVSNMIVRHTRVDRSKTLQIQLPSSSHGMTGASGQVIENTPQSEGEEVDVYFFKLNRFASEDDLEKELKLRGLRLDIHAQAQVNGDDPAFAIKYQNGCQWKDDEGNWQSIVFHRQDEWLSMSFYHNNGTWSGDWWFAGVRE